MPELNQPDGSTKLKYEANDWFYMQPKCVGRTDDPNSSCYQNQYEVEHLQYSTNKLGSTVTQYNDAKLLYNRELLFTLNILVGLAMLCYYIYLNQSAVTSPIKNMGNAIKSLSAPSPPLAK